MLCWLIILPCSQPHRHLEEDAPDRPHGLSLLLPLIQLLLQLTLIKLRVPFVNAPCAPIAWGSAKTASKSTAPCVARPITIVAIPVAWNGPCVSIVLPCITRLGTLCIWTNELTNNSVVERISLVYLHTGTHIWTRRSVLHAHRDRLSLTIPNNEASNSSNKYRLEFPLPCVSLARFLHSW
jgi:hypothetical protein